MIKPHSIEDAKKKLQVMAGIVSMMSKHPELTDAMREIIVEPRARVNRFFLRRAIERGEIRADVDVDMVAMVSASMASYRTLMLRKPVTRDFLISVIDSVILPAVGLRQTAPRA